MARKSRNTTLKLRLAGLLFLTACLSLGLSLQFAASASEELPDLAPLFEESSDFEAPSYEEPSISEVLRGLGFTNVTQSPVQTFPSGLYEVVLYAEFAEYHESNMLMYYPLTNSSNLVVLITGVEGSLGYATPPVSKVFSCQSGFGLSLYVHQENYSYYSENWRNPDGQIHSEVYLNLGNPSLYVIAFEDLYDLGDRDFNDLVLSLRSIQHYLVVETDPLGIQTISGEGWYNHYTNVTVNALDPVLISPGIRYTFKHWDIDGFPESTSLNPITVTMDANHTATAHFERQYYLTVKTEPHGVAAISGEGWFDENSEINLEAPLVEDYTFVEWTVDGASQGAGVISITVKMDGPQTATANYEPVAIGGSTTSTGSHKLTAWTCLSVTLIETTILTAYGTKRLKRKTPSAKSLR